MICHQPRMVQLVERRVTGKTDGKCLDRLLHDPCHGRDHRSGVYAAAEESPQGHVADEPHPHGLLKQLAQSLDVLLLQERWIGNFLRWWLPISIDGYRSIFDDQLMRRRQLENILKECVGRRHVTVAKV